MTILAETCGHVPLTWPVALTVLFALALIGLLLYVDHRCHNRGCVRPDHLRLATNKQNQENLSGPHQDSSSGVRGVSWEKGRWRACVVHDGHKINVGRFVTLDEAEAAVRAKRLELFTHNDLDRT